MKLPISWINEYVKFPKNTKPEVIVKNLVSLGYEVESVEIFGDVSGPLVVGKVENIEILTEFKKSIRYCKVNIGNKINGVICGASNFVEGDLVVVALPGATLPGEFKISERETYGKISQGMICSAKELGFSDNHEGIIVLPKPIKIGANAKEILGLGETVLDISVLPDRGYAMSVRGIGRELALSMGVKFIDPINQKVGKVKKSTKLKTKIISKSASKIALVSLTDYNTDSRTPIFMQNRLAQSAIRLISLPVDITNYLMLEIGQPLHAFDADKVSGNIQIRNAKKGEVIETLDHVKRKLNETDLVIADGKKAVSIAGVMGGLESEITGKTKNVIIESAIFDRGTISKTSRNLKLPSEASKRFERGTDPAINEFCAILAAQYLAKYGNAKIKGIAIDKKPSKTHHITFHKSEFKRLTGFDLSPNVIEKIFKDLGINFSKSSGKYKISAPSWRYDLNNQADLVEELIRIWGYDKIPSRLPQTHLGKGLTDSQKKIKALSIKMASLGSNEVLNYPFISQAQIDNLGVNKSDKRRQLVRLANPLSEEAPYLRTSLFPGLFTAATRNISRGIDNVSIFEQGSAFFSSKKSVKRVSPKLLKRPSNKELDDLNDLLPLQPRLMAGLFIGNRGFSGWHKEDTPFQWHHPIEIVDQLGKELGIEITVKNVQFAPFHPGRCAEVSIGGVVIGHAGQFNPSSLEKYGLLGNVFGFEIDIDLLIQESSSITAPVFSVMPIVKEDLAFVVAQDVSASSVVRTIKKSAGVVLEEVRLFDVYEGSNLGLGKKSLAFNLRFRASDRTLETDEIAKIRVKVIKAVEQTHGGSLRS